MAVGNSIATPNNVHDAKMGGRVPFIASLLYSLLAAVASGKKSLVEVQFFHVASLILSIFLLP